MPTTNTTTKKKTEQEQNAIINANVNSATFDSANGFTQNDVSQTYADILKSQGVSTNTNPAYADYAQMNTATAGNTALASTGTVTATGTPTTATQTATAVPATATATNTEETPVITNPTDVQLAYEGIANSNGANSTETSEEIGTTGTTGSTSTTQANSSYPSNLSAENIQKLRDAGYRINEEYAEMVRQLDDEYYKAQSNYGANAEALAQAGLTNSGYSDYLDAAAYAETQRGKVSALETKQADEQEALQNVLAEEEANNSNVEAAYAALIENGGATTTNMAALRAQFGEDVANAAQSRYAEYENSDAYKTDNYETINNIANTISQVGGSDISDWDKEYLISTYGQRAYDLAVESYEKAKEEQIAKMPTAFEQVIDDASMLDSYLAARGITVEDQATEAETLAAKQEAFFKSVDDWYNLIDNPTDEQKKQYESVYKSVFDNTFNDIDTDDTAIRLDRLIEVAKTLDGCVDKLSTETLNKYVSEAFDTLGFNMKSNHDYKTEGFTTVDTFSFETGDGTIKEQFHKDTSNPVAKTGVVGKYLSKVPSDVDFAYFDGKFYTRYTFLDGTNSWATIMGVGAGEEAKALQTYCELLKLRSNVKASGTK